MKSCNVKITVYSHPRLGWWWLRIAAIPLPNTPAAAHTVKSVLSEF